MSNLIGKNVETIDGHSGIVIKQYRATGFGMQVHIKQKNGQIWYCPENNILDIKEDKQ